LKITLFGLKVCIVGGSRGIGLAIANMLVHEGAQVAICGRDAIQLSIALTTLQTGTGKAIGQALDVKDHNALRHWVEASSVEMEGLDVYIGNAAAMLNATTDAHWHEEISVGLIGLVAGADAARPFLMESNRASIIFINSVSGQEVGNKATAYNATKAGLLAHAKGLAHELAVEEVRVNTISPGAIYHENGVWGQVKENNPEYFSQVKEANPMKRFGSTEDISNAVAFLVSDRAAFINGANLVIDGGATRAV
jgi:3-oxoacyl-[acyl-carrier protein] reductase